MAGPFFSAAVEQALDDIYYNMRAGRGKEGFTLLQRASAAGDADATYFLSRCYAGSQYVWSEHGFPVDERKVSELVRLSVERGSAVGVLGEMRSGDLTRALEEKMPFENLKQAWDIVLQKAEGGEPFCMYMIGNTYFWGDILTIEELDLSAMQQAGVAAEVLREKLTNCERWFERAFEKGVYFAGLNLENYYRKGKEGLVEPQPEKAADINRRGARYGYPNWQYWYAQELDKKGEKSEALHWYEEAARGGQRCSWYYVGLAYEKGELVQKDLHRAMACYQNGMEDKGDSNCLSKAGALYYQGSPEIPQDYAKAVQCFERAVSLGNNWPNDMLAYCYLKGLGCRADPVRARELLEKVEWNSPLRSRCLGEIYLNGLGVQEDIKKGAEYLQGYLQNGGDDPEVRHLLMGVKKTFFGKWVRRK